MNSRNSRICVVLSMGLLAAACGTKGGKTTMEKPTAADARTASKGAKKSGHLAVNGLSYYYEIHGEGEPILLLHGGLGSIDMFRPFLLKLGEGRQIIAVDLHGHGRTSLGDRDISLIDMGDDMAKQVMGVIMAFSVALVAAACDRGTSPTESPDAGVSKPRNDQTGDTKAHKKAERGGKKPPDEGEPINPANPGGPQKKKVP